MPRSLTPIVVAPASAFSVAGGWHPLRVERWAEAFYADRYRWRRFMEKHGAATAAPLPFRAPTRRAQR